MRDLFHSAGKWWEWVKDRFRSFFQDASRAAARKKKSEFRQLQSKLQRLFELEFADSLALVQYRIEYVKSRKVQVALVSLDQEKVFDHVSHEFMERTIRALGLGDLFCDVVTNPFRVLSGVRQGCPLSPLLLVFVIELLAECIRQNRDIRGVTVPGSRGNGEVKCSLYMGNVSVFCTDGRSIKELEKNFIEFGKASVAKINSAKSETILLGHWTPTRAPLPFPIKQDFLKIFGVLFRWRRCFGEVMELKTGEDKVEAGTLEPPEAVDQREVFGAVEQDPTSAPAHRTSVTCAATNGQGHHENDLLLHLC
ncbi:hypothetical protein NDU88_001858 [Pleurodeles waltl]|uniref:Reverse transcriptase domain-containing protein n=1 Tax=Pleurodeles waltl TaxID=8319 RepID=A0AAV7T0P5_PLEWA|nr:hypothetical protein NDU88_001858 [Pleurodeles waltl]